MDLLLDVNVVIDLCTPRPGWYVQARDAVNRCKERGSRVWLYAGSVQTLLYTLIQSLKETNTTLSNRACARIAQRTLSEFVRDKHWLAALSGEGNVFDAQDPEDEQLLRALNRFPQGQIALLTRDASLLARNDARILSPEQYLSKDITPSKIEFVDLKTQQDALRPQLESRIHRVLHHGQYILGPEVRELEERLAAYTGAKHCVTVASGTEGLLIALMALGIGPGDEVITTPFTFVATAEVIVLLGAKPVFVDIEPDTCNIDAFKIEAAITPRTRAIVPVSLYGQPADMDRINDIATRHGNVPVIEDAAQSFGATYRERMSCNLSTVGCTSFFPSKPLGCYGDGGAAFTSDDLLAKAMREIRVHGQERRYYHTRLGVGGRMDTLQCAAVLAKLERFNWEVERRRSLGKRYGHLLTRAGARAQATALRSERTSVHAQYTIMVSNRDDVVRALRKEGIPSAVHYPVPLHQQPAYRNGCVAGSLTIAETVAAQVVSLPMHADLDDAAMERIVRVIAAAAT